MFENMTREKFEEYYQPRFNDLFTMVNHIGPELNSRKNRFDKADLLEAGLEAATHGSLKWVDEIGYDCLDQTRNIKYEVKSQGNCLYTAKGSLKKKTSEIKLSNSLSQKVDHKPSDEADFLIIIDTKSFSAAIISYKEVLEKYTTSKRDGFSCKIPTDELTFLAHYSEISLHNTEKVVPSYAEEKRLLQESVVSAFF